MKVSTTIVLALVLVILGGLYLFLPSEPQGAAPTDGETPQLLPALSVNDLTRIEIVRPNEATIVFERGPQPDAATPGDWRLVEPVSAATDSWRVDDLARTLIGLTVRSTVDSTAPSAADPATIGLAPPRATFKLIDGQGTSHALAIGNQLALSTNTYVKKLDAAEIHVVSRDLENLVTRDAADYRAKTILNTTRREIVGVELTQEGSMFALERAGDSWRLTAPVQSAADADAVEQLLGTLTGLRAVEFEKTDAAGVEYGFGQPLLKVSVTVEETVPAVESAEEGDTPEPTVTTRRVQAFVVGAGTDLRATTRYASIVGEPTVFTLRSSDVEELTPDLGRLRNPQLVGIAPDAITELVVRVADEALTLTKADGRWEATGPIEAIDQATVQQFATTLTDLRAIDFIDAPEPLSVYGLDEPRAAITFTSPDQATREVLLGAETSSGRNAYAKLADEETVVVINARLADFLARPLIALRSRDIFAFDTAQLAAFTVHNGPLSVDLSRGDDGWEITTPEGAPLAAEAARAMVRDLSSLRATDVLARGAVEALGALDADLRFQLQLKTDDADEQTQTRELIIAAGDEGAFATTGQRDFLYRLDETVYRTLSQPVIAPAVFAFQPNDVAAITLDAGTAAQYELRRTDDGWQYPDDPYVAIDQERVGDLLTQLAELAVTRWGAYGLGDQARETSSDLFADPAATIRIALSEAQAEAVALFLGPQERGVLTRLAGTLPAGHIFRLDAVEVADLLQPLEHYLVTEGDDAGSPAP